MKEQAYFPTVLIVDDDPACTTYWREKFLSDTSVGVITANTLSEGRHLLNKKDVHIDGVVSDLYFDKGADDSAHDLNDGVDFLAYGSKERPELKQYVMSYFARRSDYKQRAESSGVTVRGWFQKEFYTKNDLVLPWLEIERDLIASRLQSDEQVRKHAESLGFPSAEDIDRIAQLVQQLALPKRTYLQDLEDPRFVIIEPIEVICVQESKDESRAYAPRLGLLQDGRGETTADALSDLREIIVRLKDALDDEPLDNIAGFTKLVKERLDACIKNA